MSTIKFTKMHGAGNDYVYVNAMKYPISNPEEVAVKWSDRHKGIGSDGLILIDHSDVADFKMRMFNNDGSEGIMCGNGIRCIGKYVYDNRLTTSKTVTIETLGGIKTLHLFTDEHDFVTKARVDMGTPLLTNTKQFALNGGSMLMGTISLDTANGATKLYTGTYVCMGNPHFVIFVDDITKVDVTAEGSALEVHKAFPQKCNIEFAQVHKDGVVRTRVWERGTGITQACGTGACATAVATILTHQAQDHVTIAMDGGNLYIEWDGKGHLFMTGPATTVFTGEIEL